MYSLFYSFISSNFVVVPATTAPFLIQSLNFLLLHFLAVVKRVAVGSYVVSTADAIYKSVDDVAADGADDSDD